MTPYKLFFTTDIHGSERCFRKFVNAGKFYETQAIILGGDITGKAIIPIVSAGSGIYKATITSKERLLTKDELEDFEKEIRFNGYYPYVTDPDELAVIESDPRGIEKLFKKAIKTSLEMWLALAEERLKPLGIKIFISPGNDDDFIVDDVLASYSYVINPEERVVSIEDGVEMMSFGYANPTPWNSPREMAENELLPHLEALAQKMDYNSVTIFNLHTPPYDTAIDQAPKLDANLKPVVEGGQVAMAGCGSHSVRDVIMKYQPDLGLHGHVHESAGMVKLGKTICLNPGSEYNDGVLRGAIVSIDIKKKKINYQLTVG